MHFEDARNSFQTTGKNSLERRLFLVEKKIQKPCDSESDESDDDFFKE